MTGAAILALPARDLAREINAEYDAARRAAISALEHAKRCGALLIEAKSQERHGDWLKWLAAKCPERASYAPPLGQFFVRASRC